MTFTMKGAHHAIEYCIYCGTQTFSGGEEHVFEYPVEIGGEIYYIGCECGFNGFEAMSG